MFSSHILILTRWYSSGLFSFYINCYLDLSSTNYMCYCLHFVLIMLWYSGEWMASWLQKRSSGNESRARKEKMMKWVFQTLAKDRDWITFSKDVKKLDVLQSYPLLICIEFSFQFGFLWYSSFVVNFLRFFKWLFRPTKILLLRHSQKNYQMGLYKLNSMREGLSYQIINTSAVNQAVFCYY